MILYQLSNSHPLVALVLLSFSIAVSEHEQLVVSDDLAEPSPLHS